MYYYKADDLLGASITITPQQQWTGQTVPELDPDTVVMKVELHKWSKYSTEDGRYEVKKLNWLGTVSTTPPTSTYEGAYGVMYYKDGKYEVDADAVGTLDYVIIITG